MVSIIAERAQAKNVLMQNSRLPRKEIVEII